MSIAASNTADEWQAYLYKKGEVFKQCSPMYRRLRIRIPRSIRKPALVSIVSPLRPYQPPALDYIRNKLYCFEITVGLSIDRQTPTDKLDLALVRDVMMPAVSYYRPPERVDARDVMIPLRIGRLTPDHFDGANLYIRISLLCCRTNTIVLVTDVEIPDEFKATALRRQPIVPRPLKKPRTIVGKAAETAVLSLPPPAAAAAAIEYKDTIGTTPPPSVASEPLLFSGISVLPGLLAIVGQNPRSLALDLRGYGVQLQGAMTALIRWNSGFRYFYIEVPDIKQWIASICYIVRSDDDQLPVAPLKTDVAAAAWKPIADAPWACPVIVDDID